MLDDLRRESEDIVRRDGHPAIIDGTVNHDVVKTLIEAERSNPSRLNNWILVFDWKTANFQTWEKVSRDPKDAVAAYSRYEKQFPESENYEVVLIGSSDIETVQKTHSHYFGLSGHGAIFEELGQSITKITDDFEMNKGSKIILSRMKKKKIWGEAKGIQRQTLKNHFCKDVDKFEECLDFLIKAGYLLDKGGAGVTLNLHLASEIEKLV